MESTRLHYIHHNLNRNEQLNGRRSCGPQALLASREGVGAAPLAEARKSQPGHLFTKELRGCLAVVEPLHLELVQAHLSDRFLMMAVLADGWVQHQRSIRETDHVLKPFVQRQEMEMLTKIEPGDLTSQQVA